jgi:Domain of unknown function (DUF4214)
VNRATPGEIQMSFPPSFPLDFITELYIGYYDRAPDTVGGEFWLIAFLSAVGPGVDPTLELTTLANDFANSSESTAIYPFLTLPNPANAASFVTQVYANLLNRAPDAPGLAFWTVELQSGAVTPGGFIITVEASVNMQVGTADALTLANKITVAEDYIARITAADVTYTHASAFGALVPVTNDPATVALGEGVTTAFLNPPVTLTATAGMLPTTVVTGNSASGSLIFAPGPGSTNFGDLIAQPGFWSVLPGAPGGGLDLTQSATFGTSVDQKFVSHGSVDDFVTEIPIASWATGGGNLGLVNASGVFLGGLPPGPTPPGLLFDSTIEFIASGGTIGGPGNTSANVIEITDTTFANAAALAQALASGAYNLILAPAMPSGRSMDLIFAYSDGSNVHIADVNVVNGGRFNHNAGIALSLETIHVSDMVQLTGVATTNVLSASSIHFNILN